jgi:hypothetical protein
MLSLFGDVTAIADRVTDRVTEKVLDLLSVYLIVLPCYLCYLINIPLMTRGT